MPIVSHALAGRAKSKVGRFFALALSALLVFGFAPVAKADVAGLTPCSESARFQQRASAASTPQAVARFKMYSKASCGEDGLPHLIVDGRWNHAGDFVLPGLMFLYITGTIGWAGREYLEPAKRFRGRCRDAGSLRLAGHRRKKLCDTHAKPVQSG